MSLITVTKNDNVVFTTVENSNVDQLIECKSIWEHLFEFQSVRKNEIWFETIVHDIDIIVFDNITDMKLLKNEVEMFNQNYKLIRISIWLTKKKNREEKQHFFVRLIFNIEKKSINAVKNELIIAEAICKCSKYVNIKFTD